MKKKKAASKGKKRLKLSWKFPLTALALAAALTCALIALKSQPAPRHATSVSVAVQRLDPAPYTPLPKVSPLQHLLQRPAQTLFTPSSPSEEAPEEAGPTPPSPAVVQPALPPGKHPRIALVIDDMGVNIAGSERALRVLPPEVTFSFLPYASRLTDQTRRSREAGHELILHMPMEPVGPQDPGPGALLTSLPADELRQRLEAALGRFAGYDGINNHMGSKFTADADDMALVADILREHQVFFLDSRTGPHSVAAQVVRDHGVPTLSRDVFLDDDMASPAVDVQLRRLEDVARRKGSAIAIGHPHPATLNELERWIPEARKRGYTFVPLHDLVR